MNEDAKRILTDQTGREDIEKLIQAMEKLNEQLSYLIEILE